jgi:NTE family protein
MDGDLSESELARGDPVERLAALPMFADLGAAALGALAAELEWLALPGGATLFLAGEPADSIYLVTAGCLGAFDPEAPERMLARIPAGETVGEMGVLSGRGRSATVRALRDSDLARLPAAAFEALSERHPAILRRLARLVVERSSTAARRAARSGPRTYTVLPQSIEVDVGGFATELVEALGAIGRTELVWSVRGAEHTSAWFHRIESANEFVVYVADPEATPWTRLCARQADTVLLLARAEAEAAPWPLTPAGPTAQTELVLLHEGAVGAGAARRWRAFAPGRWHHHVRGTEDILRLARWLTGRAIGLVLSGGGARGFAHIGVVRALREAGLPIDLIGGTSIGAIMGAGVAAGWTDAQMVERFHRTFVATNPLSDYTLPAVSLVSGRKVSRLLRQEFGDVAIEDLPLPFFAVSANLTTGQGSVHRDGPLWRSLRASVAIPGILPPVFDAGAVHVDGGAINNLPVDVMRAQHRGFVVGVDVGSDSTFAADIEEIDLPPLWKMLGWFRRHKERPTILQILVRAGTVNTTAASAAGRELSDLLLQPPLASVDLLNWKAFARAVDAGYRHAAERLAALDAPARRHLGLPG